MAVSITEVIKPAFTLLQKIRNGCDHDLQNNLKLLLSAKSQGGGTPIHSVLRAVTAVKIKVKSQAKKSVSQRSSGIPVGQDSTY